MSHMTQRLQGFALLLAALLPAGASAQAIQSATLRRAQQAYDNLDYRQALSLTQASLKERLTPTDRVQAYQLLGFTYSVLDSLTRAVDAFKQVVFIDPERSLDPNKVPAKTYATFEVALRQVLVVRQLQVDSSAFVAGQGGVAIRYVVTQPARVVTRAVGDKGSFLVDSSVWNGQVNLTWPARLRTGDPVPAGTYTVVVEASIGQNTASTSQQVRLTLGAVDTLPHLTALPGYTDLPETEIPPRSWRPMGLAFLYTGIASAGTLAMENSSLGTGSRRELGVVSAGALITGFIMTTLKKPAPQPAQGNILYNRLLREQLVRRNNEIASDNVKRRQQVELTIVPLPKGAK
jgi:hypothetical protein